MTANILKRRLRAATNYIVVTMVTLFFTWFIINISVMARHVHIQLKQSSVFIVS